MMKTMVNSSNRHLNGYERMSLQRNDDTDAIILLLICDCSDEEE
jgi:hypothetical protein